MLSEICAGNFLTTEPEASGVPIYAAGGDINGEGTYPQGNTNTLKVKLMKGEANVDSADVDNTSEVLWDAELITPLGGQFAGVNDYKLYDADPCTGALDERHSVDILVQEEM
jgi:hypothetical protein